MQIITTVWFHLIRVRLVIIKQQQMLVRMWGKTNSPYTLGENVNWYNHYRNQYGCSSKKLKIDLLYDPTIPFLSTYLK
jgi:hypothetical protein